MRIVSEPVDMIAESLLRPAAGRQKAKKTGSLQVSLH